MKQEMKHYHPKGEEIISSFVNGINAYIDLTMKNSDLLPIEFRLLGIKPGYWDTEIVVSRHNGLFRNVQDEVRIAQLVNIIGADKVKSLYDFHPSA
ncbi:MAG: penicillin acylase family protein [Candidatus Helarchaeota archaeon]|nr:penicillin acylase family protein [Candidatus Helarchaeota archaeon]